MVSKCSEVLTYDLKQTKHRRQPSCGNVSCSYCGVRVTDLFFCWGSLVNRKCPSTYKTRQASTGKVTPPLLFPFLFATYFSHTYRYTHFSLYAISFCHPSLFYAGSVTFGDYNSQNPRVESHYQARQMGYSRSSSQKKQHFWAFNTFTLFTMLNTTSPPASYCQICGTSAELSNISNSGLSDSFLKPGRGWEHPRLLDPAK